MSDRHEKWVAVEPGFVIPAGQPYRIEASGYASEHWGKTPERTLKDTDLGWFVDSSWRPPLELPTEPTWGIAVFGKRAEFGQWQRTTTGSIIFADRSHVWGPRDLNFLTDFIKCSPEQVERLERAR